MTARRVVFNSRFNESQFQGVIIFLTTVASLALQLLEWKMRYMDFHNLGNSNMRTIWNIFLTLKMYKAELFPVGEVLSVDCKVARLIVQYAHLSKRNLFHLLKILSCKESKYLIFHLSQYVIHLCKQ